MRLGLIGILIIIGALIYTGAGGMIEQSLQNLNQGCYNMLSSAGPSISGPACRGVSTLVTSINGMGDSVGNFVRNAVSHLTPSK